MGVILTGLNGTVAPVLAQTLRKAGAEVVRWDRDAVAIDDPAAIEDFLRSTAPDWLCHLATGPPEWAASIARACQEQGVRLLFTSSVSVFSGNGSSPITPEQEPDAEDDYGRYKRECERLVTEACPGALLARLGWQIGDAPGSNNMVDYLATRCEEDCSIRLNRDWTPSTAFLSDTADALVRLLQEESTGVYHLEGNPGWSMPRIAERLAQRLGFDWNIVSTEDPPYNNRMADGRVAVRPISERLA
ncbi:MAG: sugar nucleotide-binding protein [Planctomycetota bacterium]